MEWYQAIVCVLQNGHRSVLLTPGDGQSEDRWQLPAFFPATEAYNTNFPAASEALQQQLGIARVCIRYAVRLSNVGSPLNVYVAEPLRERTASSGDGSRWFSVEDLSTLHFSSPIQGELLLAWLRDIAGNANIDLLPWWREGWIGEAENRIHVILRTDKRTRHPDTEQLRGAYTSAVLRTETDRETVYLKAVAPPFQHEARLTKVLSAEYPDQLPVILNASEIENTRTNCPEMLMTDVGGEPVGSHSALSTWTETVHRYAVIQSDSVGRIESFLKSGCVDLRVATLRNRLSRFPSRLQSALKGSPAGLTETEWGRLDTLLPQFQKGLERLAGVGLPDCLEHGDLHVGNLRWISAKKTPVFLDWSHACITFPFYGYGTLLLDDDWFGPDAQTASARVEWAYLSPWAAYAGAEKLAGAFVVWKPLRHLFIAERQIEIIASFQTLWADANQGAGTPCGDALRQLQWWLRDAARQLLAAHKNFH